MGRIVTMAEFEDKDNELHDITSGLVMRSGSLARLVMDAIEAYLGGTLRLEERDEVAKRSERSYAHDYSDDKVYTAVESAIEKADLKGNYALNNVLANQMVELVRMQCRMRQPTEGRPLKLGDVGAGKGNTTIAVLNAIAMDEETSKFAPFLKFYLIDPSDEVFEQARTKMRKHGLKLEKCRNFKIEEDTFRNAFEDKPDGFFDIIYSTAVCHHFSDCGYLGLMHSKLHDNGALVMADWFTHVWSHPAYLIPILRAYGADDSRINRFRSLFNVSVDYRTLYDALPYEERKANDEMYAFLFALGTEMGKLDRSIRLKFFEAHEPLDRRLWKMGEHGFRLMDLDEMRAKYGAFLNQRDSVIKVFPKTTIGAVILACKDPKNRRFPNHTF